MAARVQYGIDANLKGVLITSVEKDSEAADLGIVPGDVLTFAQDTAVSALSEVHDVARKAYDEGRPFLAALIQNKKGAKWMSLSLGQ